MLEYSVYYGRCRRTQYEPCKKLRTEPVLSVIIDISEPICAAAFPAMPLTPDRSLPIAPEAAESSCLPHVSSVDRLQFQ